MKCDCKNFDCRETSECGFYCYNCDVWFPDNEDRVDVEEGSFCKECWQSFEK